MRAATESHGRMILQSRNADPVQYNGLIDSTNLERPRTSLKVHARSELNTQRRESTVNGSQYSIENNLNR